MVKCCLQDCTVQVCRHIGVLVRSLDLCFSDASTLYTRPLSKKSFRAKRIGRLSLPTAVPVESHFRSFLRLHGRLSHLHQVLDIVLALIFVEWDEILRQIDVVLQLISF